MAAVGFNLPTIDARSSPIFEISDHFYDMDPLLSHNIKYFLPFFPLLFIYLSRIVQKAISLIQH